MRTSAPVASRATKCRRPSRLAGLLLIAACAGCGGHARPSLTITPSRSLSTRSVAFRLNGLDPNAPVTLTLRSRDATGTRWISTTRLRANAAGKATAGTGAIYRMTAPHKRGAFYIWSDTRAMTFRATASQRGAVKGVATLTRRLGPITTARETLARDGFVGEYAAPRGGGRGPALLVFGGSEGGLASAFLGASLAGSGYATLAIAYFHEPGLPATLSRVRLEYFARALRWLAAQPQVDPRRIFVLGISRGSEAAQLLGVHYPKLVHGVVAVVPSNLVNCSYPTCDGSAWTFHGRPLPYEQALGLLDPRSRIPDERIHGPVLFICAAVDELWTSCSFARDAMFHMRRDPFVHQLVVASKSGHGVGALVPFEPNPASTDPGAELNELGREAVWPQLLAFLKKNA